jgi:hypothetical protein
MIRSVSFALVAALALAGCGMTGDLARPAPLYGDAKRAYEAEQRAKAEAAKTAEEEKNANRQRVEVPITPAPAPKPQ